MARNGVYSALATLGVPATEYLGHSGHGNQYGCGCNATAGAPNGVLAVEWHRVEPVDQDPSADGGFCGRSFRVYISIRMLRCWQSWNMTLGNYTDGAPVDAVKAATLSNAVTDEGWRSVMALTSFMEDPVNGVDGCTWGLESLTPIEPSGQCHGWQLDVYFNLEACA